MKLTDIWKDSWYAATQNTPNTLPSGFNTASTNSGTTTDKGIHKWQVGDKVHISHDDMKDEYTVKEQLASNMWGIPEYMLQDSTGHFIYQMESDLVAPGGAERLGSALPTPKKPQCECGADTLHGKNSSSIFHSTWCPKGRKD